MAKINLLILVLTLTLFSCGTKPNPQYSLEISKSSDFLKNGDKIKLILNNPINEDIKNIKFKINDSLIAVSYTHLTLPTKA